MLRKLIVLLARLSARFLPKPARAVDRVLLNRGRYLKYHNWAITQGNVHLVQNWEEDFVWVAELSYSYSVRGEYYSGVSRWQFFTEADAEEFTKSLADGVQIFVRHHPEQPQRSAFLVEDQHHLAALPVP